MKFENGWQSFLGVEKNLQPGLKDHIEADVAIVGGGMTGLSAAMALADSGLKIVLLEKSFIAGSCSGKSAGFLTPDSELELWQLINRYGKKKATNLWNAAEYGTDLIINRVKSYGISCDLEKESSLFGGIRKSGKEDVEEELKARKKLHLSQKFYDGEEAKTVIHSDAFSAVLTYDDTAVINSFLYCQGLKNILLDKGVTIYESTSMTGMEGHKIISERGSVMAKHIIITADKLPNHLSPFTKYIYPAQTFLAVSEPLTDDQVRLVFPVERYQCWDTKLIYTYFRLTKDNRIAIGGGSKWSTFLSREIKSPGIIKHVINEWKNKFPQLRSLVFESFWNGRIDTTRDLLPFISKHPKHSFITYVQGCTGLPWACFAGDLAGRGILKPPGENDKKYFRYFGKRSWIFPSWLDVLLGKKLSFSLSSLWAKVYS